MSLTDNKKINPDNELLAKAFINYKNLHLQKVLEELGKRKFETVDEIGWAGSIGLRLSAAIMHDNCNLHLEKTPKSLMDKFGLPESIDTSKDENKNIIIKNKSLKGLFYLSMALITLNMASKGLDENNYEEYVACTLLSIEVFTHYEAQNFESDIKHMQAKFYARMRHSETYALKKQAKEYWLEHIDRKLSNPKAADLLMKIVPVSHRKLVEYVAEAKRENIHSAG